MRGYDRLEVAPEKRLLSRAAGERALEAFPIKTRLLPYKKGMEIPKNQYTKWFDYDIIKNSLTVRTRQPEDVLGVNRQGGTQKLKSYFINEKIPAKSRERILLIAEGHQILWVVGYRMSSRYQISEHTKRIIEIKIMEDKKHGRDN